MTPPASLGTDHSGRRSLDLTWTIRYRAVRPTELLRTPADLRRWLRLAGLPAPRRCTEQELLDARSLREAVHRSAVASIDGGAPNREDRALLNRWAAEPPPSPVLRPDRSQRTVAPAGREVAAALSALARDAIGLLSGDDGRLRRCDGPQCSLLFHDGSRPGTRRWCSTARCGNRVNTRAYRSRRQADEP